MKSRENKAISLKILLPSEVYLDRDDVTNIVVESPRGYFGILPHRLDCVTPLVPGILAYTSQRDGKTFVAIDYGTLVKKENIVLVSVRNAKTGVGLGKLHQIIQEEFLAESEKDKIVRTALAKLENNFVKCYLELKERG